MICLVSPLFPRLAPHTLAPQPRRYSTDYTDSCTIKTGQNNNGYVANAADYSPPSQSTLLLRNGSSNTSSDTTYYPNGQVPSVNSTLTRNSRSTAIDTRQDIGLPNVHGSFNSLQNSILSEYGHGIVAPWTWSYASVRFYGDREVPIWLWWPPPTFHRRRISIVPVVDDAVPVPDCTGDMANTHTHNEQAQAMHRMKATRRLYWSEWRGGHDARQIV